MKSVLDIKKRISESDLVSSRMVLLENLDDNFRKLEACGYDTPDKLRDGLKSKKRLEFVHEESGLSIDYLKILKRELESYFPKKIKLTDFIYADQTVVGRCIQDGVKDSIVFYEQYKGIDIEDNALKTLYNQVQLTRIQWVSPMAAEMFIQAGYTSPEIIRNSDAEQFCSDVMEVNRVHKFFKGNIGLRDMKRVIKSAWYVE